MASPPGSISALPLPPPPGRVALISRWNPGSCTLLGGHCGGAQASAGLAQSRFKLNWLIAKCFCCLPAWFFFFSSKSWMLSKIQNKTTKKFSLLKSLKQESSEGRMLDRKEGHRG